MNSRPRRPSAWARAQPSTALTSGSRLLHCICGRDAGFLRGSTGLGGEPSKQFLSEIVATLHEREVGRAEKSLQRRRGSTWPACCSLEGYLQG